MVRELQSNDNDVVLLPAYRRLFIKYSQIKPTKRYRFSSLMCLFTQYLIIIGQLNYAKTTLIQR